jgi:hypothetical protein
MTAEGRIKAAVKRTLSRFDDLYQHWPVQNGMGAPTLDCVACYRGVYFAIETKAPGKKPTSRQVNTIRQMRAAGGTVFIIDSADHPDLIFWLQWLKKEAPATGGGEGVAGANLSEENT